MLGDFLSKDSVRSLLRCSKKTLMVAVPPPLLARAVLGRSLNIPFVEISVDDRTLVLLLVVAVSTALLDMWLELGGSSDALVTPPLPRLLDIPDDACYYCVRKPAISKCGGCRLVYYCGRSCQMQAWRKHRHVCGAAAAATSRVQRSSRSITPSQWRDLVEYADFTKGLLAPHGVVPVNPSVVAEVLKKLGAYVNQHPEIVSQEMADSIWAAAVSMRTDGDLNRLHMAWVWAFLEASVECGSADGFLLALGLRQGLMPDLGRMTRWMKRALCQALLMLNRRQEVGAFFRTSPRLTTL